MLETEEEHYVLCIRKDWADMLVICDSHEKDLIGNPGLDRIAKYYFDASTGNFILYSAGDYDYKTRIDLLKDVESCGKYNIYR